LAEEVVGVVSLCNYWLSFVLLNGIKALAETEKSVISS